jgi:hypothetical protein
MHQAPTTHYLHRSSTLNTPHVLPGTVLPPRDTFAGHPEILTAYDRFEALSAAMKTNKAKAAKARADAAAAKQQHARDLRDAIAAGTDTSKVRNRADELNATADTLDDLAAEAKRGAIETGHDLAGLIHDAAPELFGACEDTMTSTAEDVRAAVTHLRTVWADWSAAWHVRFILSRSAFAGGTLTTYQSSAPLPPEVSAALDVLEDHLASLDRLKADEAIVTAWRKEQDAAQARNLAEANR